MNTSITDTFNEMILFLFNSAMKEDKAGNLKIIR